MNTLSPSSSAKPTLQVNMKGVVLGYIFLILPLFDMLNGFLIGQGYLTAGALASPSQIGRFVGIILLFACTSKYKYSPYAIIFFFTIVVLEAALFARHGNVVGLAVGFANIIRFLYMYLAFVAFTQYLYRDFVPLIRFLKYNLILICFSIIFASFTGLANSTYGWGTGTKGFFSSGNGLGIYIGVATLILAAMKRYRIYSRVNVSVFALSAITLVLLGTKTSFLLFLIVVFSTLWSGRLKILIIPSIVLGITLFLAQISDEFVRRFDIVILRFKNASSLTDFILSGRNTFVENAWSEFASQDPDALRWFFGGGAFLSYQNPLFVKSFDTLESDVFDVFFMYGFVGVIFYAVCLFSSARPFISKPWMLLPVALLWGHSLLAGHVLFSGLGATLIVIILAIGLRFKENIVVSSRTDGVVRRGANREVR